MSKSFHRTYTSPLFSKFNLLKINDICKLEIAKKMFGYRTNPEMHTTSILKAVNQSHNYNTRLASNLNYSLCRKRTNLGKNSFSYVGPQIWHNVPLDLKTISFSLFKKKYMHYLINNYSQC